jgi:ATP/maltotriose-dependent transcriptional regulator MalT
MGNYIDAKRYDEQALNLWVEEVRDSWGVAVTHRELGNLAVSRKAYEEARRYYQQSLGYYKKSGQISETINTLFRIVDWLVAQDRNEAGVELLALIHQNPMGITRVRDRAERILTRQQADLPPDVFAAAVERGKSLDLDQVLADFLNTPEPPRTRLDANQSLLEPLSERELEVLRLVTSGLSNAEIAERLVVEISTVKKHLNHIYDKLGVETRTQALLRAQALNLL